MIFSIKKAISVAIAVATMCLFATAQGQTIQLRDATTDTQVSNITIAVNPGAIATAKQYKIVRTDSTTPATVSLSFTGNSLLPVYLHVSPTAGSTPLSFSVSALSPAPSTAQQISGFLTVMSGSSTLASFPVNFNVGNTGGGNNGGTLNVDTSALSSFDLNTGSSGTQTVSVTSAVTGEVQFDTSVSTDNGGFWLTADSTAGTETTPQNVRITANAYNGLPTGTYTGTVTFTPKNQSGNPSTVKVTLNVNGGSGTGVLTFNPTSLTFNLGSSTGLSSQGVHVTASQATAFGLSSSAGWLSATATNNSTTPSDLTITVNPAYIPSGTISVTGSVYVTPSGSVTQSIPVTVNLGGSTGNISATPTSLTFTGNAGAATQAQTVQIAAPTTGANYYTNITYSDSSNWLTVANTNCSGICTTPATLNVTADATSLQAGTYHATINVIVYGSSQGSVNIPITFTVGAAQTVTISPTSLTFSGTAGSSQNPTGQTFTITSTAAGAAYTATASATSCGGNWLSVTPASGSTASASPFTATTTVNVATAGIPVTGSAQTCTGTISIVSGSTTQTLNVTLNAQAAPQPVITTILNGASFLPGPISAGELITIKGSNLGPSTGVSFALDANGMVPTTLSNAQVLLDNVAVPLIYVSANQINAIVPYEVAGRSTVNVTVKVNGVNSSGISQQVATTAPGIFMAANSTQAAMLNASGSYNGPACTAQPCSTAPATKGSYVSIYATGEGTVTPLPATGSVTKTTPPYAQLLNGPVTVKVGGVAIPASDVVYQGPAPALVAGVLQVNFRVPDFVNTAQPVPLTIVIGGKESQPVTFVVQ